MPYKFNNYSKHVGTRGKYDWYEWSVFMDEPKEKLEQVARVEYRLHETFPNPIRVVDDRESRFALRASGWGEFVIRIVIYLNSGSEEYEEYRLDLSKPDSPIPDQNS